MAVKFPLKMPDGAAARTIEELREHFDLRTVLDYYSNGRLAEWLEERYYDEEAQKVSELDLTSEKFKEELCAILGVPYMERIDERIDVGDIVKRNERLERLKKYTTDDGILASVDNVAFTQSELADLLKRLDSLEVDDEDNRVIYLCGESFIIPGKISGVIYRGINNPTVGFDSEVVEAGIDLQDLEIDLKDNNDFEVFSGTFYKSFDNNSILGAKLLCMASGKGSVKAQTLLGECYRNGFGVEKNDKDAEKWLRKAAGQGIADAQYRVGMWYPETDEEQEEWLRKAAEQGHADAAYELAGWYVGVVGDDDEAEKWYRKALQLGYRETSDDLKWLVRRSEEVKDVVTKESNSGFKEAEELNEKLEDAADALGVIHKRLMGVFFGEKTEDENNVVPFEKREK